MEEVLVASALTRIFLEEVLGLSGMDAEVVHAIIGWSYTNQACAECASHQAKLEKLLALALSGCEEQEALNALLEGLDPNTSYN